MNPKISIIIPALREEALINNAVERAGSASAFAKTEIIVVDGDPGKSTLRAITDPTVVKISGPVGRGAQMNTGADAAAGEILLFLHADTFLPETAGKSILAVCREKDIAGGAFDLAIDSPRQVFRLIEKAATLRSRLTRVPYGDQAIFIKADFFRRLGGFKGIPLMEDIDLMRRVRRQGYRIRFVPDPVKTSARRWEKEGVVYTTVRNWILSTLFYAGVDPERLKNYYRQ